MTSTDKYPGKTDYHGLIEDEEFAIRHSGEMPEVAFHTSLHFLQDDPHGPGITVSPEDITRLKNAVARRYRRILMRDLNPRYRNRSIFRGLARAKSNWERLARFCRRNHRDLAPFRQETGKALLAFLTVETADVASGHSPAFGHCAAADLLCFANSLDLAAEQLPDGWEMVCLRSEV